MAVWTSAKARAATVGAGAGLAARTSASVCSSHLSTTLSLDEGPYWLKLNSDLGPFGIPDPGDGGGLEAAATADGTEPRVVTTRRIARPVATARAPLRCLNKTSSSLNWTFALTGEVMGARTAEAKRRRRPHGLIGGARSDG